MSDPVDEYGEASIFQSLDDDDVEYVIVGGCIDILSDIPDIDGQPVSYSELRARATFAPTDELRIPVAALADIIDSKTRANRAKDREALPEFHEL